MDSTPSVAEMLSRLDEQIAHHAEREAFHAGHEAFHRDQRSYAPAPQAPREERCRRACRRILVCAAAMRLTLPKPRQRQPGGLGGSRRSLKVRTATIAIAATCPEARASGPASRPSKSRRTKPHGTRRSKARRDRPQLQR
jgi:hypothetical protein